MVFFASINGFRLTKDTLHPAYIKPIRKPRQPSKCMIARPAQMTPDVTPWPPKWPRRSLEGEMPVDVNYAPYLARRTSEARAEGLTTCFILVTPQARGCSIPWCELDQFKLK